MDFRELNGIVACVKQAENLKNTLRFSYTSKGRQESTAEHSWRLCLLVMVLKKALSGLDMEKMLKLAVVHDLGEAVSGDIPAVKQDACSRKSARERERMLEVCASLPEDTRTELLALWDEYESTSTPEGRVMKALDKVETIIQHNQGKNPLDFDYTFNLDYGQEYADALPELHQLRALIDEETLCRAVEQRSGRDAAMPAGPGD